jgi:predicted ATPase
LSAEGEWLRRLQPLEGPEAGGEVGASDALAYPAIEMFVSRAAANDRGFEITDGNAETIAELCRRLDGLPLAIEFAASRIEEFGLDGVAARLGDRFNLLSKGRRTALPRHRTLRQTLDWSYELLSVTEAACLRSLSMFLAPFSLGDAAAVLAFEEEQTVEALLGDLTAKSMLSLSRDEFGISYRLLDMTREYARLKLSEAGEAEECSLKHALHCLELLKKAEGDWNDGLTPGWLWQYGRRVWDVRQSIEWSLSKPEHISLGVQITAHSSVLYTSLGLVDQHHVELNRAIAANAGLHDPDPIMDARLFSALGNVLYQVRGHVNDDATRVAFAKAVDASRRAGDRAFEVRSLSGLSASYLIRGRHPEALALEDQLIEAGGENDHAVQRTLAHSTFFEGMMARAKGHIESALGTSVGGHGISSTGAQFDHRMVTLRSTLATYLFVAGKPESAMTVVKECVDDAASLSHPISLCHMLCGSAIPIGFALGGPSAARPFLDLLTRTARAHSIGTWMHWAACYGALIVPRSERAGTEAERVLQDATEHGANGTTVEFMSTLGLDHVEPAFVDAALSQHAKWCRPELVRIRGELNLEASGDAEAAEGVFRQAVAMAVEAKMPAWELRAAASLARILNQRNERVEAASFLADAMGRVEEGHGGVDYVAAMRLMAVLN